MLTRYLNMNDVWYQDDNEKYYYCMDFSSNESIQSTDSLSGTPSVNSEIRGGFDSDLSITDISQSGLYVCMWIEGGTKHKTYKIEVQAQTTDGVKLEGDGFLRIGN